ncbi:MAG: membrane protein insertion efficiency factor YidD [Rhodospirillaceae bacterium]
MTVKTQSTGQRITVVAIGVYQVLISPLLGQRCRYHPTCSRYTAAAVVEHGILIGGWMGLKRLLRCHPWASGGTDPVILGKNSSSFSTEAKLER